MSDTELTPEQESTIGLLAEIHDSVRVDTAAPGRFPGRFHVRLEVGSWITEERFVPIAVYRMDPDGRLTLLAETASEYRS